MASSGVNEPDNVIIECEPLGDFERLAERWRSLEVVADASPFLSWLWMYSWLKLRDQWPNAYVVSAWRYSKLVGITLLLKNTKYFTRFIPVTSLYINEAGDPALDMIIEHNGFLMDPEFENVTARAMCEFIEHNMTETDGVFISGVSDTSVTFEYLRDSAWQWKTERQSEGWFVDLASLRSGQISYIASLSKNRRYQIRRSIRAYERHGSIQLERADGLDEAIAWFDELKKLHRATWVSRGERGAFSWKEREHFYQGLVEGGIPTGAVDIVRVKAGETTIGILFNLCKDDIVYYLQSGFDYSVEPKHRPGIVTLSLAIQLYADLGVNRFDFLAGGETYKSILADHNYVLLWGTARKRKAKFLLIDALRGAKQSLASFVEGSSSRV